jgi:hypothetical protein
VRASGKLHVGEASLLVKPTAAREPLVVGALGPSVDVGEDEAGDPDDRARRHSDQGKSIRLRSARVEDPRARALRTLRTEFRQARRMTLRTVQARPESWKEARRRNVVVFKAIRRKQ